MEEASNFAHLYLLGRYSSLEFRLLFFVWRLKTLKTLKTMGKDVFLRQNKRG